MILRGRRLCFGGASAPAWSARLTTTLAASKTLSATRSLRTMALPFCGWTRGSSNTNIRSGPHHPRGTPSLGGQVVTCDCAGLGGAATTYPVARNESASGRRAHATFVRTGRVAVAFGVVCWRSGHSFVVADVSAKRSIVARRLHDRPLDVLHSCRSTSESLARVAEWQTQWI